MDKKTYIMRRGNGCKRLLSGILCVVLIVTACSGISFAQPEKVKAAERTLTNPSIVPDNSMKAGQKVTWNCIWFGSYPQAEVVPASEEYKALPEKLLQKEDLIRDDTLFQTLQSATDWDEQGDIVIGNEKFRRIKKEDVTADLSDYYHWINETDYHYFKYQPIKWRVLSVNGSEAFLLADKALDARQYHAKYESVTWEGCTMRSWLNGYGASANIQKQDYSSSNFLDIAFSTSAQSAIKETAVENKDNLNYGTDGGNDTKDRVFLLSQSEVFTDAARKQGFASVYDTYDEARRAKSSVFAKAMGIWSDDSGGYVGNCYWWLRSPGEDAGDAAFVLYDGWGSGLNHFVNDEYFGMRPALNLNLNAFPSFWLYAGTVCSDGAVEETGKEEAGDDILYSDEVISDSYGVSSHKRTKEGELWHQSKNLVKAYNNYLKVIKSGFQSDYKVLNDDSEKYKDLREYDENADDRETRRLIYQGSDIPDKAVDDTYEVLYAFLMKCMETGVRAGIIDLDADESNEPIKIEAKTVNKIYDKLKSNGESFSMKGKNGYIVELRAVGDFEQLFSRLTVTGKKDGKRKVYTGSFRSDGKLVSQAMNQYIGDLLSWAKKLQEEAAFSLWDDFRSVSLLSDISEVMLKDYLQEKKDYLLKKGYGKLLENLLQMKKADELLKNISSAKNGTSFSNTLPSLNLNELYQEIGKFNFTDSEIKNGAVKVAAEKAELARKNIESALYSYLHNDGTIDDMNAVEKTKDYWKVSWQGSVDVAVYDENGELLGSVSEDKGIASAADDICMELDGNVKAVYLPKDKKVDFKLSGTDEGSMDYVMEEYEDGIAVGRLNYYDVPLLKGIEYSQSVVTNTLPDNIAAMPLTLKEENKKIEADEYISGADKTKNVLIKGAVGGKGTIYGDGKYAIGGVVELTAIVSDKGYRFCGWYEEGALVESEAIYRFTALKRVTVTALFEKVPEVVSDYDYKIFTCRPELQSQDKDNANLVFYKKGENLADIIISIYGAEDAWDTEMTMRMYKDAKWTDSIVVEAKGDWAYRYRIKDVPLQGWSAIELKSDVLLVVIARVKIDEEFPIPTEIPTTAPSAKPSVRPYYPYIPSATDTPAPTVTPTVSPEATATPSTAPTISPTVKPTAAPTETPTPAPVETPEPTLKPEETPKATVKPAAKPKPSVRPDTEKDKKPNSVKKLKKGSKVMDKKTKAVYEITGIGKNRTAEYTKSTKKNPASVSVPSSVKLSGKSYKVASVGKVAFKGSKRLKTVKLGENVRTIGKQAFFGCKKLTDVEFGKNLVTIEADAFSKCTSLRIIIVPAKVKKIGDRAFYQCRNLRYMMFQTKKLTSGSVGKNVFSGCYRSPRIKTDKSVWKRYSLIFGKSGMPGKALYVIDPVKLVI